MATPPPATDTPLTQWRERTTIYALLLLVVRWLDHRVRGAALIGILLIVGALAGLELATIFVGFASGALAYPYGPGSQAALGGLLFDSWLLLAGLAVTLTLMVTSLISSLKRSLRANRAALADLERLNADLDATVERRTAELRRTAALLEATQRVARVGGLAFDQEQIALEWTAEMYCIHAVPPGTPLDQALLERLYPGDSWRALLDAARQLGATGSSVELELPARTLDGLPIWVRVSGTVEPGGGPPRYVGAVQDITAQRQADLDRARDAAEAATRAKLAFLASMSHQIRTPLNAVIGMASMLGGSRLTSEQRAMVETINAGGQALLTVISDIIDFAQVESGCLELDQAPFDLHSCIAAAIDLVGQAARQKGLRIGYSLDASLPQVIVGDVARLRQVLLNLLGNAVKFTSQGSVELHASAEAAGADPPRLTICVSDSGIGIGPEQINQIFEPFVSAEGGMARRRGGSGLGLAISRQLVSLMGGTISVASAPGVGSIFSLTIPITVVSPTLIAHPGELVALADRPLRILVAEDNQINQEAVGRMLTWLGHEVTLVDNGLSAVQSILQTAYDAVLMDVQMPNLDGESATRRIRALGARIAQPYIIALTANALGGDRERSLAAGMDDYLSKPVLPADLQRALSRAARAELASAPAPAVPSGDALVQWPLIDQLAASLRYGQPAATASIRRLFEDVLPPQIEAIAIAIGAGEPQDIRIAAHRLRGGCLQMGALALAALCARIETADTPGELTDLVAQLRACYARTRAQVYQRYP